MNTLAKVSKITQFSRNPAVIVIIMHFMVRFIGYSWGWGQLFYLDYRKICINIWFILLNFWTFLGHFRSIWFNSLSNSRLLTKMTKIWQKVTKNDKTNGKKRQKNDKNDKIPLIFGFDWLFARYMSTIWSFLVCFRSISCIFLRISSPFWPISLHSAVIWRWLCISRGIDLLVIQRSTFSTLISISQQRGGVYDKWCHLMRGQPAAYLRNDGGIGKEGPLCPPIVYVVIFSL